MHAELASLVAAMVCEHRVTGDTCGRGRNRPVKDPVGSVAVLRGRLRLAKLACVQKGRCAHSADVDSGHHCLAWWGWYRKKVRRWWDFSFRLPSNVGGAEMHMEHSMEHSMDS